MQTTSNAASGNGNGRDLWRSSSTTESLQLKVSVMDKMGITYAFGSFAQLAAAQKQFRLATILWGAAEQLGEESFRAAWAEGRAMKMHETIEYALTLSSD